MGVMPRGPVLWRPAPRCDGGAPTGVPASTTDPPAAPVQQERSPRTRKDDSRISLVFRVAVTGHRWIRNDDEVAQRAVDTALRDAFHRCSNHSTYWTPVEKAVV